MAPPAGSPVVPKDYPPPFDDHELIVAPTDPEDERIEVGVAIVGGGPAGLACANRLLDLLAGEPELMEKLGEVPVAVIEKGKVCGAHTLSGANMKPAAMRELFPDLDPSDWPFAYQEVTKDAVYLLTKRAALPLKPMPPNFRNHGNYVISVSKLSRFLAEQAEEKGAYILTETVADRLLVEDRIVRGIRSGDRGRGKDGEPLSQLRAGLGRGREGHRARRGHARAPDPGGARLLRPARLPAHPLGGRGEGGLGGGEAARPGDPHDGLATAQAGEVERVRRQLHLPDGRGQALHRAGDRARLHRLDPLLPRPAAGDEDPPVHQEDADRRQAGRMGREDDPLGRLLLDAPQPRGPGDGDRRRRGEHGQHPDPEGHPLRDPRRDLRRRGDLRGAEARFGQPRRLRRARSAAPRSTATCSSRATCASRSRRASSSAARSPAR